MTWIQHLPFGNKTMSFWFTSGWHFLMCKLELVQFSHSLSQNYPTLLARIMTMIQDCSMGLLYMTVVLLYDLLQCTKLWQELCTNMQFSFHSLFLVMSHKNTCSVIALQVCLHCMQPVFVRVQASTSLSWTQITQAKKDFHVTSQQKF